MRRSADAQRGVPDLAARPLSAGALSDLIDRKPHLPRPLAAQILPPPLPSTDPGKHLRRKPGVTRAMPAAKRMAG